MSSFGTHMLIGAVAGFAVYHLADANGIAIGATWWTSQPLIVASSMLLATVPDIDEPNSFIARRAVAVSTLCGVLLAVMTTLLVRQVIWLPVAVIGGGALGHIAGHLAVRGIRRVAGGHRRLTHSLVLAGVFAVIASLAWWRGSLAIAVAPAAMAWAIGVHVIGDLVTPAGVPLLYPFSSYRMRILPMVLARHGEALIAIVTLLIGGVLLNRVYGGVVWHP